MANEKNTDASRHDKARDLAEKAVDAAIDGDSKKARDLADRAADTDPSAVDEVRREIDADRSKAEKYEGG